MKEDKTEVECRIKGKFRTKDIKATNPVAVGDRVEFEPVEDGTGAITAIEDRKNAILRKATKLSSRMHVIAANVDQAMLVATLAMPQTTTGFIDRFLATAEAYRVPVIIVFNKADILDEELQSEATELVRMYTAIGYTCLKASAFDGKSLADLQRLLTGKVTLLAGNSGVGKSTLINAIEPGLNLKAAEVSGAHERGVHTTTHAEMFELSQGGYAIDSPGIKSFGMVDFDKKELWHFFKEIFRTGQHCKFHNCLHLEEPKCAVKAAVEAGEIAGFRYENYAALYHADDLETEY